MSRCVPSWDVEDGGKNVGRRVKVGLRAPSNSMSSNLDVPTLDYEVAELTWKNGQLAMHGLGPPRLVYKSAQGGGGGDSGNEAALTKYTWDKPHATETLEAIVNQATLKPHSKPDADHYADELVPWLDHPSSAVAAGSVSASATMTMDALVPTQGTNVSRAGCSTRVGSCSSDRSGFGGGGGGVPTAAAHEWSSSRDQSVSGSDTFGMESSRQLTVDRELGVKRRFTSTSMGSPDDTLSGKRSTKSTSPDEHDSVCHSRPQKRIADCNRLRRQYKGSDNVHAQQKHKNELDEKLKAKGKSSIATKRSRTVAIHNQSERRRRDKINEKMKTLQKLVPNANKTDKASMLDEVIEYLKQLQAQIQMMGRMNMSPMMMPLAMQQQIQMAMMNPMAGMGMGLGMGIPGVMDLNTIGSNHPGMPPVAFHPSAFMQPMMATSWADMHATGGDRGPNHNDPMATFLASQAQPMTMEGYTRMAAMFQQMQNQTCFPGLKN